MPRVFMTAEWRNLVIVSYHVSPELVERHLPRGLEPDPIGEGGRQGLATVSLVGFEFRNTRVFGIPWPGFTNFPEWNLRAYVRTSEPSGASRRSAAPGTPASSRRGVIFLREFVGSRIVSRIARKMYNEPYATAPMRHATKVENGRAWTRYGVRFNHAEHVLEATASSKLFITSEGSIEHALKEQRWGFGRTRDGRTLCYDVLHPHWQIYENTTCRVDIDWARLYGAEWADMLGVKPFSTMLVEGSAVTVTTATVL